MRKRLCELVDRPMWKQYKHDGNVDGEIPEGVHAQEVAGTGDLPSPDVIIQTKSTQREILHQEARCRTSWMHQRVCGP